MTIKAHLPCFFAFRIFLCVSYVFYSPLGHSCLSYCGSHGEEKGMAACVCGEIG